jgi:hypothetical protein
MTRICHVMVKAGLQAFCLRGVVFRNGWEMVGSIVDRPQEGEESSCVEF